MLPQGANSCGAPAGTGARPRHTDAAGVVAVAVRHAVGDGAGVEGDALYSS